VGTRQLQIQYLLGALVLEDKSALLLELIVLLKEAAQPHQVNVLMPKAAAQQRLHFFLMLKVVQLMHPVHPLMLKEAVPLLRVTILMLKVEARQHLVHLLMLKVREIEHLLKQ
jgi:hypothetical protein